MRTTFAGWTMAFATSGPRRAEQDDLIHERGTKNLRPVADRRLYRDVRSDHARPPRCDPSRPAVVRSSCDSVACHDTAVPRTDGSLRPRAAAYRFGVVLPLVEALLAADRLRPAFLFDLVKTRVLEEPD